MAVKGGKEGTPQDYIAVGFQAFWDAAGDKGVLGAVEKIAQEIDKVLTGAVNFAKSFEAIEKIAANFEKVAKASGAIESAAQKGKKAVKEQVESVEDLIQAYLQLNAALSAKSGSDPYNVSRDIAIRVKAIETLKKALQGGGGEQKDWLTEQYKMQSQALEQNRAQFKRLTTESDALRASVEGTTKNAERYREEIKRANAETKRWSGERFSEEGIDRQIGQYKKLIEIRRRQADEGIISDEKSAQIISRLNAQVRELTKIKQMEARVDRETKEAREANRKAELAEMERLTQAQRKLEQTLAKRATGGTDAELALRAKLEKELSQIILRRIQLGDDDVVKLRKQYEALSQNRVGVEELVASYNRLKTALSQGGGDTTLASIRTKLLQIREAMAALDQMRGMPGADKTGIKLDTETQKLIEQKALLTAKQRDLNKEAIAEYEAEKKKSAELEKQSTLIERQIAEMQRLVAVEIEAQKLGGASGAQLEIDSIKKQKQLLAEMGKSGAIGPESNAQQYANLDQALTHATTRLREFKKAEAETARSSASQNKESVDAVKKLEAEYDALGAKISKLGSSMAGAILKQDLYNKQMSVAKKLVNEYDYDIGKLERDLNGVAAAQAKNSAAVQNANHRMGRSFKDLIKWQMEWYSGTMLILGGVMAFGQAMRDAFAFTQEIRNAGAVIGATSSELEAMRTAALTVGSTTTMSAKEAAEALKVLGQAGLDAKEAIQSLDVVAKMMMATGSDVTDVVNAMTTAINVWEFSGEKIADLGNMMAAAMNYSKLEMKDLGVVFNYLASVSKQVGWSFEQASAAAAVLANHGIRTSTIGTGLSAAITSLIAPTSKMVNVFKQYGIAMEDVDPRMKSFADILDLMKEKGMGVEAIFQAFTKREARLMVAAVNAGGQAFRDMEADLVDNNAMIKMTVDSLKGARNQFVLLGNEIQNRLNKILSDSESGLAAFASGLNTVAKGTMDVGVELLVFNAAMLTAKSLIGLVTGASAALGRALSFVGGWWGVVAIAVSSAIALYSTFHKTTDERIADIKKEADANLAIIEAIRQRNVALKEAQAKIDTNKESEQDLVRIRDDMVAKYPELIKYLFAEGESVNGNVKSYEALARAMAALKAKGIEDLGAPSEGYFAKMALQLKELEAKAKESRDWFTRAGVSRAPEGVEDPFNNLSPEYLDTLALQEKAAASDLQAKREKIIADLQIQTKKLIHAGEPAEKVKTFISTGYDEETRTRLLKFYDDLINADTKAKEKQKANVKLTAEESKKKITDISNAYKELVENISDSFDAIKERVDASTSPQETRSKKLVDLERERVVTTMRVLEYEANEKIALIWKTEGDAQHQLAETAKVEANLSKNRRKLYNEMYAFAKGEAQKTLGEIDKTYNWLEKGLQTEVKYKEQWFKVEENSTAMSIRRTISFYKDRAQQIMDLDDAATQQRLKNLKESGLSSKDFAEMSEKVIRDSVENQIKAHEDLRDSLFDTYKELKTQIKEVKKESEDLKKKSGEDSKAFGEALRKAMGKGAGTTPFSEIEKQMRSLEREMNDLMMAGSKDNWEKAVALRKEAIELLGKVDSEKLGNFPSLAKSEMESFHKTIESGAAQATKLIEATNKANIAAKEAGAKSVERDVQSKEQEIRDLRDQMATSEGISIKLKIDKDDLKRQLGDADIIMQPKLAADQAAKFKDALQGLQGVDVPVMPKLDEAGWVFVKTALEQPTTNPHTVQANTAEAQAAIAALKADTHSTHYVHVVTVGGGGGGESGGGEAASAEGYATGGYLGGGWGGGDRLHILAELGEYINRKEAVRYYGKNFFDLLNARALPKELFVRHDIPKFKEGGPVEIPAQGTSGSSEFFVVRLQVGDHEFPLEVNRSSKGTFDEFVDRYGKEKLMRRKR